MKKLMLFFLLGMVVGHAFVGCMDHKNKLVQVRVKQFIKWNSNRNRFFLKLDLKQLLMSADAAKKKKDKVEIKRFVNQHIEHYYTNDVRRKGVNKKRQLRQYR
jgi:hypothetical protein